jgi:hypothetical protein
LSAHWLDLLTALGHERSPVEQAVYDEAAAVVKDDEDDLDDLDENDADADEDSTD